MSCLSTKGSGEAKIQMQVLLTPKFMFFPLLSSACPFLYSSCVLGIERKLFCLGCPFFVCISKGDVALYLDYWCVQNTCPWKLYNDHGLKLLFPPWKPKWVNYSLTCICEHVHHKGKKHFVALQRTIHGKENTLKLDFSPSTLNYAEIKVTLDNSLPLH